MISEEDVDAVFNVAAISKLAEVADAPPGADLAHLTDSAKMMARGYLSQRALTNWRAIEREIKALWSLVGKAEYNVNAAAELAQRVIALSVGTRNWLGPVPAPNEIKNPKTRKQALSQMRCAISPGAKLVLGRRRGESKRSWSLQPSLRTPQNLPNSRPPDMAARSLIRGLALTYMELTSQDVPYCVSLGTPGPFLRFARAFFRLLQIKVGNVVELINERGAVQRDLENQRLSPPFP